MILDVSFQRIFMVPSIHILIKIVMLLQVSSEELLNWKVKTTTNHCWFGVQENHYVNFVTFKIFANFYFIHYTKKIILI